MRAQPDELATHLATSRREIDDALDRRLPPLGTAPASLHAAMRYSLLAPGKRLRGALVLAIDELVRGSRPAALELACALELVHASALILDDLPCMDDARLRRGKPVLHRVAGEAVAILAAIELLQMAFAWLQELPVRGALRAELTARLARAIGAGGLIGGQIADLEAVGLTLDLDALERIHSHKTGALFIAAGEMAARLAGARERERAALAQYAKNLGLAFQITDDLLDFSGRPEVLGKDAQQDRERTTFVDLCGIDGSRRLVDELVGAALGALEPFGRRARLLHGFAEYVRQRDR
ncbi:MAG TPA: polyprenyl synthetase family protein [Candidatus Polarisedimenticolaceae bacterium]|nr:polyprenyl synthetase family protein [Candidatus Polarisedimenticolaceae bacterium]